MLTTELKTKLGHHKEFRAVVLTKNLMFDETYEKLSCLKFPWPKQTYFTMDIGKKNTNAHRQHLNEKQVKYCREGFLGKLKRMSREMRKICLRIMLSTMKKK